MLKLLSLISFFIAFAAQALPPESILEVRGGLFSLYQSQDLKSFNDKIERAIITVHGSERNAHTYYNSIDGLTKKLGLVDSVLILAPHFKEAPDQLARNEFYFDPEGWLSGDGALNATSVSSFDVMDEIINLISDKTNFPNLKEIVLTGHSAGGQLIQRYAAGSDVDLNKTQIKFRYIVANPGSYVYLTSKRPVRPQVRCSFNDYKYGLDRLNSYMDKSSKDKIQKRYAAKKVIYFLGEKDIRSDDIDQTCPAQYQGNTRLERGKYFKEQMDEVFPQSHHLIFTVPGVGHTQYGMYTSELGQKVLFQEL